MPLPSDMSTGGIVICMSIICTHHFYAQAGFLPGGGGQGGRAFAPPPLVLACLPLDMLRILFYM